MRFPIAGAANFRQRIARASGPIHFASSTASRRLILARGDDVRASPRACVRLAQDGSPSRDSLPACARGNDSLRHWRHPRTLRLPQAGARSHRPRHRATRLARRALEIYIGDYVDRGPDSKGVIDLLIARSTAASIVALSGNHEIVMESFLCGQTPFEDWRRLGGLETILSYGVDARGLLEKGGVRPRDLAENVPASHLRFISSLKSVYTDRPVLFRSCRTQAWRRDRAAVDGRPCLDPRRLLEFSRTFRIYRRPRTHARDKHRLSKQQN